MKTAIYRSNVKTPLGTFIFAVDSTAVDARTDTITAAIAEFGCHTGLIRVDEPQRSNHRILSDMWPVKRCQTNGTTWAWYIR